MSKNSVSRGTMIEKRSKKDPEIGQHRICLVMRQKKKSLRCKRGLGIRGKKKKGKNVLNFE